MADTKKFLCLYNEVFASDGGVKACGRDKCLELINECQAIAPKEDPNYYGTTKEQNEGWMNVPRIRALYIQIHPNA